jgi:hypothetical protein
LTLARRPRVTTGVLTIYNYWTLYLIWCAFELEYEGFVALIGEIKSLGYDEETASHYAALIGDTPVFDETGLLVVLEGDAVLARLPLKYFDE